MHILFLSDNFPPETNAPASRTFEHAKEWVNLGHSVTVITCFPNFPSGRVFEGYSNKLWAIETLSGIRIIRVWSYIAKNEGFIKRTLDYLSYMLTSFIAALFVRDVDIVVGTSPQFFTCVSAWLTSKVKKKPYIFELRDLWPESIRVVMGINQNILLSLIEKVELFLYREAASIVSVTNSFKANLIGRNISANKIHVVTNGVTLNNFVPRARDQELIDLLGLKDKFVVGYIGTHGMAHSLETILFAAKIIQSENIFSQIHLILLGEGAEKTRLQLVARDLNLCNVTFIDPVPKSEVVRYWSLLDISIVHLRKSELFKSVIPSKIFECMSMGIPILHCVEGESADLIEENAVGVTLASEDPYQMAQQIKDLFLEPERLQEMQKNGPKAASKYDRKILARKMLSTLEQSIKKREHKT